MILSSFSLRSLVFLQPARFWKLEVQVERNRDVRRHGQWVGIQRCPFPLQYFRSWRLRDGNSLVGKTVQIMWITTY